VLLCKSLDFAKHSINFQVSVEVIVSNVPGCIDNAPEYFVLESLYNVNITFTICGTRFTSHKFYSLSIQYTYVFLWISEQIAIIFLNKMNLLVFRRVREIAKATISFYMSVRPNGTPRLPLDVFS